MAAKQKIKKSWFIKGTLYEIQSKYDELLKSDIEIISTTIVQDFQKYGNFEQFILVITYEFTHEI